MKIAIALIALTALTAGLNANAQNASVYTSIAKSDCRTIEDSQLQKNPEIDFYTGHCPGKGGFTVVISGGDIRYSLSLIKGGRAIQLTNIGAFHGMASTKVEWRGPANTGRYDSLIYRMSVADGEKSAQFLYVTRLKGRRSCLVGIVSQSAGMNQQARAIADDLSLPCLPEEQN